MVISKLKKAAVALALLSTFGAANALEVDFGTLTTTVGASNIAVVGSFNDTFSFTAGSAPGVEAGVLGFDVFGGLKAKYKLGTSLAGASMDNVTWFYSSPLAAIPSDEEGLFAYKTTFNSLVAGTKYWVNVEGSAKFAKYSVTLAPVPEPETYALLLAGLGMLATVVRRRRIAIAA